MPEVSPYGVEESRRRSREERENILLEIQNQLQHDSERARRVLSVQMVTGLPAEVADASLDELEKQVNQRDFDVDSWRDQAPAWTAFAAKNPYHLAVMRDDLENMGTFERATNAIALGWDSTWHQVELGRLQARRAKGDHREGDETRIAELMQDQVAHEFGAPGWFSKFLVKNAKMAGPTLYSLGKGLELGLAGAIAGGGTALILGQAGPQALAPEEIFTVPIGLTTGLGIGMLSGRSIAAMELETGFAYQEYIEMGLDHETASYAAHSVGLVNAALESIALGKVTKYIPGFRGGNRVVSDVLLRPSMRRATATAALRFGEVLGTEIVTEVMQESVTAITGDLIGGQSLTWDAYIDRISSVAVETLQGAAIMSSFGPGMSYYTDMRRAQHAKRLKGAFEALGEAAKDSTTRKALPKKYREFVDYMTEKGELKTLLMEVDRFDEYWQKQDMDPDEVATHLGIKPEELQRVRDSETYIEIPLNEYADKIAPTEHHAGMYPDIKRDADSMSLNESKEWYANADELQQAMADQIAPEGHQANPEIRDAILGQLLAAGEEYGAAEKQATLHEYVFSTLGERNNIDPMVLFNRYWGGVYRETDPALLKGGEDVDVIIDPLLERLRAGDVPTQWDIFGESLTDFLRSRGGLRDQGGELAARDVKKSIPGLVRDTGMTLDEAAEAAAEVGFLLERDPDLLLEQIEREIAGEATFAYGIKDENLASLGRALEELEQLLGEEGLDLDTMTNAEIRKRLEGGTVYRQSKTDDEISELLELAVVSAAHDPKMLTQALILLDKLAEFQDFGELTFTDKVPVKGFAGVVEIEANAQQVFDTAVKRRTVIDKLLECISG